VNERGIEVDPEKLKDWNEWSEEWTHLLSSDRREDAKQGKTLLGESDAVGQLILGRPARVDHGEWLPTFASQLAKAQQEDGSWKPGGQLPTQKRKPRETAEVSTMWNLIALLDHEPSPEIDPLLDKASAWLGKETRGASTEWWAVKLILRGSLARHRDAAPETAELRAELLSRQREDGSWGWLSAEDGDALGTGIALYALAKDGLEPSSDPATRAIRFLSETQKEDGSWPVPGTKAKAKGRVTETATYWGTCWAVIGMLELPAMAER